jgi:hypothetical protein
MKKLLLAGVAALGLSGCAMNPGDTNPVSLAYSRPAPLATSPFEQGRADRMAWENWAYQQSGDIRDGASWWWGQRSLSQPGDCNSLNNAQQVTGCVSARARLDPTDRRLRSHDGYYELGWMSWQSRVAAEDPLGSPPSIAPRVVAAPVGQPEQVSGRYEIPLRREGGVLAVPVKINDTITLNFTIDSGAADVSIPADVVLTLTRAGTISEADFLGKRNYVLADGSTVPSNTFRIRSLRVGGREITNVTGSVAGVKGSLLLGQSFLKRFTSWSIDNSRQMLVLN